MDQDRRRDRRALRLGFSTVRYGWHELTQSAEGVRAELVDLLGPTRSAHHSPGLTRSTGRADQAKLPALLPWAFGDLLGAIGYDVFRIPFIVGGLPLLAPIDSYGCSSSTPPPARSSPDSPRWSYHFTNGIGFGIAYAVVALGRRGPWAEGDLDHLRRFATPRSTSSSRQSAGIRRDRRSRPIRSRPWVRRRR